MKIDEEVSIMQSKRIEVIDYFRGLSILGVVMYHLISLYMTSVPSIIKYAANVGSSGVLIFFFCSGFAMHYSQKRKPLTFIAFLKKKASKIYVPYILVILVSAIIPVMQTPEGGNRLIAVLSHTFQFRIFSNVYFESFGGHWWYLGTLFQFYLFYLLFLLLEKIMQKINGGGYLLLCTGISIGYVICLAMSGCENSLILSRLCFKYFLEFGAGMVISDAYLNGKLNKYRINQWLIFFVGIIGVALLGLSSASALGRLLNDIPGFIGILCLFYWLYRLDIKWINQVILWFGDISFEWYLIHMLVFSCAFANSNGTLKVDIICAAVSLVISCVISVAFKKLLAT